MRRGLVDRSALGSAIRSSTLANLAGPKPTAKFVAFQSFFDRKQMPLWGEAGIQLPYVEGLRIDEAMHRWQCCAWECTAKPCRTRNGAPVRMVIPWKYGFKSIKSLVKIKFVKDQPETTGIWKVPTNMAFIPM